MRFNVDNDMLEALDDYHVKSKAMQSYYLDMDSNCLCEVDLEFSVDDDLVFNVPIYDMLDRKYAAFSSLTEAIMRPDQDPKQNGRFFEHYKRDMVDNIMLFYLFRLCGSGINYVPRENNGSEPIGTHGFGNFWVAKVLRTCQIETGPTEWLMALENWSGPFTDSKGYLLPQFSYPNQKGGHMKRFILENSWDLVFFLHDFVVSNKQLEIFEIVDVGNEWLMSRGYKRQNFVLTAFAMDIAEYYPEYVDPQSRTYCGSNAKKCIRKIFSKKGKVSDFDFENDVLRFLADRYGSTPYSVEDSRACDVWRYFKEYQSPDHIKKNGGVEMLNNSILKTKWGEESYYNWIKNL